MYIRITNGPNMAEYQYKISVVTVCRNALEALLQTYTSVKSQTFTDYEYIVIDGASTDGTPEWLQAHNADIDIIISEPDNGIYDAMNKAIRSAHGEWIIFLNAGDTFYSKNTLQETEPYLTTPYGLVYGDIIKNRHGRFITKHAEEPHNAHRMFFCHQALFTRTELLYNTPFDIKHKLSADFKFVKQMYKKGIAMAHIPVKVALFDTTGASNQHVNRGLKDNISVIKELDNTIDRICFISRLEFKILWNRLRGKD